MNNASTPDGRGQDRPNDAELFFPSEGSFNPVVPLSELGYAPPPLPPVEAADVGQPAEADWAREAYRAGLKEEEERTLVPARAGGARQPRAGTAAVIALSVAAGLVSGTYLIWSSQRAPVAAEAPSPPPAPVAEQGAAEKNVEQVNEPARAAQPGEVAKAEQPGEVAPAPKQETPVRTSSAARAERPARAVAEPQESTPAPKPARTRNAPPARPRLTTAEKRPPAPAERTLPVSSPPPSARSKKVIQWP
jgi:hypothetical protein